MWVSQLSNIESLREDRRYVRGDRWIASQHRLRVGDMEVQLLQVLTSAVWG